MWFQQKSTKNKLEVEVTLSFNILNIGITSSDQNKQTKLKFVFNES